MVAADGIILGSPTYFADITAELKAVIDRSGMVTRANGGQLQRKVGAGVAVARRGGVMHALQSIQNYFLINEMIIPGSNYWNIAFGRNSGDVETDTEGCGDDDQAGGKYGLAARQNWPAEPLLKRVFSARNFINQGRE